MTAAPNSVEAPDPFDDETLPDLFERIARLHAQRPALGCGSWLANYDELDRAANRVCREIIVRGGTIGDRVAILMRLDSQLIAAMVGVLKAGRVVVVLNAQDPMPRLRAIIDDAQASLLITEDTLRDVAQNAADGLCAHFSYDEMRDTRSDGLQRPKPAPDDPAILIYTSGSAGRPKAVIETHRYVVSNAARHNSIMGFVPEDRITLFASLSGAQGVSVAWSALAHGAALYPFPVNERGITGLADWINDHGITVWRSSASLFRHFVSTLDDGIRFPRMRVVRIASEMATSDDFRAFCRHFTDRCSFVHCLSSSETGNISQIRLSTSDIVPDGPLSIGTITEGVEVSLLDDVGQPVQPGERGEIIVTSRYLAAGYWRNPQLTAEKFSDGPPGSGLRRYYSGDLGRIRPDGLLEHLGRKDARVKIRGFRVEPSEVQNAIGQLPSVDRAVVVPIDQPGRGTFLAAFVVSKQAAKPTVSSLRQQLRLMLPDHMIPSVFQFVDQIPLTLHGKVDRENLRNAFSAAQRGLARDLPQTEMEKRVAGIWAEVFDLPQIGRSADFFELGGDSLTAAVTAARIFQELGTEIELGFFNLHPRLADFAQAIEAVGAPTAMRTEVGAEASERPKAAPLTLAQERIWRLCQTPAKNAKYVRASIHVIEGKLDVDVLRDCMTYLERRHEILHTSFEISNGGPVQIVNAPGPTPLRVVDLSKAPDVERELAALKDRESSRQFDLAKPPLFHFTLARLRDQEFALIRSYHYIIGDGPSWRRYHRELALLYEAKMAGDAPPLPDTMAFRYADYAVWQRKELSHGTPRYREFMDWWRDQFSRISNPVDLPYLRICPVPFASPEEGYLHWHLSTEATQHLARLAIESGTTFFVTRLAAYVALLCHDAGTPDLAVGTYFGKRRGPAGQELLGLFANLTPLVFHYNSTLTFRAWLSVVQLVVAEAERRCEIPYEEICEVVAADGCSAQVRVLIINGADHSSERFAGLTLQSRRGARIGPMPWGMTLYPDERYEENAHLAFDARNYNPAAVRDFVDRYQTLLEQAARKPDMLLSALVASRTRRRAETPKLRLARLVRSLGRATLSVGRALRNSRA